MAEEQQTQHEHKEEPIIIKKKKCHDEHGAHGGSWKVAYADFVTAMMAFFIVMWIMVQSQEVKKAVEEFFKKPGVFKFALGKKAIPIDLKLQTMHQGDGEASESKERQKFVFFMPEEKRDSLYQKVLQDSTKAAERVKAIGEEFKQYLQQMISVKPELKDILESIKIEMLKEGLRIELIESAESVFFEIGSSQIKPKAREILIKIARELGKLPNYVEIEGHTDSRQYSGKAAYNNWDLSSDRANAARRVLEQSGFWIGQISKVTGFADKNLRNPANPFDITNRRISILVRHIGTDELIENENQ